MASLKPSPFQASAPEESPSLAARLEAILYLKGQPLSLADLATHAQSDRDTVEVALMDLIADYSHRDTALEIVETESGYSLQLRPAFRELVQTLVPVDLGLAAQRTLALVALKGPLLQSELVEIRGSSTYQHIQDLLELGFISRRRPSQGRSYQVQVTERFYQYFQVDKLPDLDS
ncbi:SMC-Scp complex subunit ScpB [Thermosynechococcaceae cyanobacterium BACA0444]|uniref:SMC-Scp complex subunit ScpB n=1 Tax=Pseudocalidococcus azoricus BACA0444 TaxID=2918990 RepID=A0AAE4JX61_9CYAN|nr:SMC-Scp complex subunit ScpB [Pseudocalidococcus azoricus]MDS3861851.1 SMC-Scp complex subunit ScpB [Pseudocalidococcus azoricus BACA0444]